MAPPPPPPPELTDDAVGEVLLRIPPSDPALLLRASLVCKRWRRLLTDPAFLRSYRAFHLVPPVLGFLRSQGSRARFVSTSPFHPRDPERRSCRVLDCRHGRVLLHDRTTRDFLVWDPISGDDKHIPNEMGFVSGLNAAVVCAAADCDHLDCHGGPFLVVLVAKHSSMDDETLVTAWVYSSEAGEWSKPTTVEVNNEKFFDMLLVAPVLAGDMLYFICEFGEMTFRYDLRGGRGLSVIHSRQPDLYETVVLMSAEDGGLRFAGLNDCSCELDLWSLETRDPDGVKEWTRRGVIHLDQLLTDDGSKCSPNLIGFASAPGADVVYVSTDAGVFTIELESHKVRKVDDKYCGYGPIFPYESFFTPDRAVGRLHFG